MRLVLASVGQRPPAWAVTAYDDFATRFPPELRLELKAVTAEPRTAGEHARVAPAAATAHQVAAPLHQQLAEACADRHRQQPDDRGDVCHADHLGLRPRGDLAR